MNLLCIVESSGGWWIDFGERWYCQFWRENVCEWELFVGKK